MNPMQALIAAVMNAAASKLVTTLPQHPLPQFLGQHTNPRRNEERQILRAMGKRQYKRMLVRSRRA